MAALFALGTEVSPSFLAYHPTLLRRLACFNVKTGDIEDAPGLDSLWKYSAEVKDGKIVVSASEKEVQSKVGRIVPKSKTKSASGGKENETVVIVGGGAGGIHTVESLRMVRSKSDREVCTRSNGCRTTSRGRSSSSRRRTTPLSTGELGSPLFGADRLTAQNQDVQGTGGRREQAGVAKGRRAQGRLWRRLPPGDGRSHLAQLF